MEKFENNKYGNYETIVGMEIHVELKTKSKMFCGCINNPFYAEKPNIYTCPVCLGMPGGLPVPNKQAIEWTILLGLALGCQIPDISKFDRKNYFYPDLPKGYQISQYDQPLAINGGINISSQKISKSYTKIKSQNSITKKIRIHRVHLEEDTAKLLHAYENNQAVTLVDFNRSGVPLIEIVTEPDLRSGDEAKEFLKKLQQIIRYLGISDADMEKGSMRLEPNISVRKFINRKLDNLSKQSDPQKLPEYKIEVKNINSFTFVKKAIDYETERQIKIIESGQTPVQETRGWNENKNCTVLQRIKETADDYRYFPEPDIPTMIWTKSDIDQIKKQIPQLPDEIINRYKNLGVSENYAQIIAQSKPLSAFFDHCQNLKIMEANLIASYLVNKKVDIKSSTPQQLVTQIQKSIEIREIPNEELEALINQVIQENPKAVADYKSGKTQVLGYLLGSVMKLLKSKSDVNKISALLSKSLSS